MYCPNCGTKLENGTMCPVCSCNAEFADNKIKQWEEYIAKQNEPSITSNGNKPTFKMEILLPGIIIYTIFMGWLVFGILGQDVTGDPVESFKIALENNDFETTNNTYYSYYDSSTDTTVFIDFEEYGYGVKTDEVSEIYYFNEDRFEYKEKNNGYSLTASYKVEDMNYTCETEPSTYSRSYCPRYRDGVIKEAKKVKESFEKLLINVGVDLEDLVGEDNE